MDLPVTGEKIWELIPQRPPFVMVHALIAVNETSGETTFHVPENNVFVENGLFTEPGLIENVAQSAAAMTGFSAISSGQQPKKGFIAALKNLKIYKLPKSGQTLHTQITITDHVLDFTLISGKIYDENDNFAECEMKIFINN